MKYVFLDGDRLLSPDDLHRAFADALDFPDYFGSNLDALRDCLTDVTEPVTVIAVHTGTLKEHMSRKWRGFCRLMEEMEEEEPAFRYLPEPFGENRQDETALEKEDLTD